VGELCEFVKWEDSCVLVAMEAVAAFGTAGAATELLGTMGRLANRHHRRQREKSRRDACLRQAGRRCATATAHRPRLPMLPWRRSCG
jgi:hypothetical protein